MSLKLVEQFNKPQKISKIFTHTFAVEKSTVYLIEITASAKSHKQNHSSNKFQDDGLLVEIDSQKFDQNACKWNGNDLNDLQKTVVFIIYLERGNHTVNLIPQQQPYLQQINIFEAEDSKISYQPTINNPSEDGNCRPWYSFILVNFALKLVLAIAKAKKTFFSFDDDDLQLQINREIVKNETKKSHKNWYWCGKILKGKYKEFSQELNLKSDFQFIEFYADRTPLLEKVVFEIIRESKPEAEITTKIQLYNKIDQNDYNRYDSEIIDAVKIWNNEFLQQENPQKQPLDPNLVKAMVYIETRMGQGGGANQPYPDVMQVADQRNPAIHTLNNDGWVNPKTGTIARESEFENPQKFKILDYQGEANGRIPEESIKWGVRWLYHKAQKFYGTGSKGELDPPFVREWKTWEVAVIEYNDSGRKMEYKEEVWQLYQKGIDPSGKRLW